MSDERNENQQNQQPRQDEQTQKERVFTQAQVDAIVAERLSRSRGTLEAYRAQQEREAAAQAEAQAVRDRFNACLGDKVEPVHPRLVDLMIEDFRNAINDPANSGRNDADIFFTLFGDGSYTKPKGASWIPRTKGLPRPGSSVQPDKLREAFGLTPRKD